ncbi:MAG: peptidoglycan DD-metalloendopeptidase family protein [Bacteroidetes bacterium]|nr:peptidoglycan DD-metalloendopeptidase family protein [Bacteroidota bacterium]
MENKENRKFIKKLKNTYRFIILNNNTYREVWQMRLTPLNIIAFFGTTIIIGIVIVYLAIAYTPLKEFVPGYDSNLRKTIIQNAFRLDSLENEIRLRDQYFNNLNAIIAGKQPSSDINSDNKPNEYENISFNKTNDDSILRSLIESEKKYKFTVLNNRQSTNEITGLHFFPPIKGIITNTYSSAKNHYGTDVVAPPNEVVKATLEGTVTMASWTLETGWVLQIQHENNLISVYKHNAELLKQPGDYVTAGEAIAIVGNSGELTTGPHLHFELWHNGTPLNPENFIAF